jgi:hypothetical protein
MSSLTVPIPPDLRPACRAGNTDLGTVPKPPAAFADGVHLRCLRRGQHHVNADLGEDCVECRGARGIPVTNQMGEVTACAVKISSQVAGCAAQAPVGWAVTPSRWARRVRCSITKRRIQLLRGHYVDMKKVDRE